MSVAMGAIPSIEPGMAVVTIDGQTIGRVKEVQEHFFKVNARFRRDYWLARNQLLLNDEHVARLSFTRDVLEAYRLARPDYEYDGADAIFSETEQAAQRARMERELLSKQ